MRFRPCYTLKVPFGKKCLDYIHHDKVHSELHNYIKRFTRYQRSNHLLAGGSESGIIGRVTSKIRPSTSSITSKIKNKKSVRLIVLYTIASGYTNASI